MANTYSQIYLQFVFAVKGRRALIPGEYKEELHKYVTGIVQNRKSKMLAVNCMPDHTHLFVGFKPALSISDFIKEVKMACTEFVKKKKWAPGFSWQTGYGAFSYSRADVDRVINYILNQEEHHHRTTFREEYLKLLAEFDVDYDQKYLFDFDALL